VSRAYSGIPVEGRKTWVVPRLVKECFVAFAIVSIAVAGTSLARIVPNRSTNEIRKYLMPFFFA